LEEVLEAGAIRRSDVLVTTRLWNNDHRPERVAHGMRGRLFGS
jgi:diketogulonate reductase-like aldo/keto reductase